MWVCAGLQGLDEVTIATAVAPILSALTRLHTNQQAHTRLTVCPGQPPVQILWLNDQLIWVQPKCASKIRYSIEESPTCQLTFTTLWASQVLTCLV